MRELDAKQLITADFLLVSGDIVSNLPLEPILQEHRLRRQADKNAIMTMILRQAAPSHRTKYVSFQITKCIARQLTILQIQGGGGRLYCRTRNLQVCLL